MAVSLSISITQNSQSIANNTSNVTVKVTASWTGGSYNHLQKSGWCKIDGTTYSFTSSFNTSNTTSGSVVIYSKTLNISHASDGKKTLSVSASYTTGVSSGTITASASKTLTTIPRKSTLSVAAGTLGTAQTLKVTRKSTSFTHTIKYTCGTASGTIATKSSSTSISFTPPLSLASQNQTGTTVSITFKITTYSGSTSVGSNSYTKTFTIPDNLKPEATVTLSDANGYKNTYGAYIKGLSQVHAAVSVVTAYSAMYSHKTTIDGSTYAGTSITSNVLKTSGTLTVKTVVTDKRGRTDTVTQSITVLAYSAPKISSFNVLRSDASGNASSGGAYLTVTFNSTITSLNNQNTAKYVLQYRKTGASSYTTVTLSAYTNNYAVSGGSYIFAADTASSYEVVLTASDALSEAGIVNSATKTGTGSSIKKLWSMLSNGLGYAFGKLAELEDYLDIGFYTRFRKPVYHDNDQAVYYKNPSGNDRNVMTLSASNNLLFGAGSYDNSDGNVYYSGNYTNLRSVEETIISGGMVRSFADILMENNYKIRGVDLDGTEFSAFQPCDSNGNTVIAYGNYKNASGDTNIYGNDVRIASAAAGNVNYIPYYKAGDSVNIYMRTAGYVTNSKTQVCFTIPLAKPVIGDPDVTVTSIDGLIMRQDGNYTHGSTASTYAKPSSYTASLNGAGNFVFVTATISTTTNAVNNSSTGIYASVKITFS